MATAQGAIGNAHTDVVCTPETFKRMTNTWINRTPENQAGMLELIKENLRDMVVFYTRMMLPKHTNLGNR